MLWLFFVTWTCILHEPSFVAGGGLRDAAAEGRDEAEGAPGQLAQVHGHLPQAAHLLLALRRLYLVRYGEGHCHPSYTLLLDTEFLC